jgi:hypothetical protein
MKPTNNRPLQGNSQLDGSQFITELRSQGMVRLAMLQQKIVDFVNNLAASAANSGSGEIAPPPPIVSMTVKTASEYVHVSHSHPGAIQRGIQYFTEVGVNDPGFKQPLVHDWGCTRTPASMMTLPTKDDGGTPINYYFRSYAQYHGSKRSDYAYWGTPANPTAVTLSGTTKMTPLASSGSGTASNNGTQGGQGLGNDLFRAATEPKRVT